jgi:replicative DNA helicase
MSEDRWEPLSPAAFRTKFDELREQQSGTHPIVPSSAPAEFFDDEEPIDEINESPPHDLKAEAALCSAAMNGALARGILPEHFYSEAHRRIMEACYCLRDEGSLVDIVTVAFKLRQMDRLSQVGGFSYLTTVLNAAPALSGVQRYADIVHAMYQLRRSAELAASIRADALSLKDFTSKLLELETLRHPLGKSKRLDSHNIIDRWTEEGPLVHEPICLGTLDEKTGGGPVYGSRWYVLGAPDACKTAFIVQTADLFARRGIMVGVFAVDEEASDIQTRLVQRMGFARKDAEDRRPETLDRMRAAVKQSHLQPIVFFDDDDTIESAAEELGAMAKSAGARAALFVDSVQTVSCNAVRSSREEPTEYVKVTNNVRAIRAAATKHHLIVLATSEMNREAYKTIRSEAAGRMAAGKQSGAIEYSARVMLAWEKAVENGKQVDGKFCVTIEKNKHGPTGDCFYVELDRARMTLSHAPSPDPIAEVAQQNAQQAAQLVVREAQRARARVEAQKARESVQSESKRQRDEQDDGACLEAIQKEPGIGAHNLRAAMAARLGGCERKRVEDAIARLQLKNLVKVEQNGSRRPVSHHPIE